MAKARVEACSYKGCAEAATYILELNGKRFNVCRSHYRELLRRLEEKAKEIGVASLSELSPTEVEGGVRSFKFRKN
ncbi:MAG: hypothetical protein QW291_03265 [Thermofilaceae archaeon]